MCSVFFCTAGFQRIDFNQQTFDVGIFFGVFIYISLAQNGGRSKQLLVKMIRTVRNLSMIDGLAKAAGIKCTTTKTDLRNAYLARKLCTNPRVAEVPASG